MGSDRGKDTGEEICRGREKIHRRGDRERVEAVVQLLTHVHTSSQWGH
jgi:hypothetical protein